MKSRIFYYKSHENPYQYCKSHENPYQVLQVTRQSVSGTTSLMRTCNEIEGSYDKIIITIVPSYTGKNITRLLPLALLLVLRTRNNTDGNKLVIFSGIALCYGDTYILLLCNTHMIGTHVVKWSIRTRYFMLEPSPSPFCFSSH